MAERPNVRLNLASRPENVFLVREMLSGVAETVDLDRNDLRDIRTAVTEACNNVVLHAYEGAEGPLEVEVYAPLHTLEAVVRDRGTGLQLQAQAADGTPTGLGLLIIQALVHNVNFRETPGDGSEVRMEFVTPNTRALESYQGDQPQLPVIEHTESATAMEVTIAPPYLARTVLPRVLSVLATHARFSTARICDAQLLADALAARASKSIDSGHLNLAVNVEPHSLELRIGPLGRGSARRLLLDSAADNLGPVIEQLTDDHRVASTGSFEVLALRLLDPPSVRGIGRGPTGVVNT
jgi:serine/threonine-protein kinase RsbW